MKNTRKLLGFTALIAAIGLLSLAGCSTPDDDGGSTGGGRKTLVSIEVNLSAGFRYTPGSDLDLSGITVTAAYSDGSTEKITDTSKLKIEGFDKNKTGEQTVTVSYGGKSITVKITDSAGSAPDYGISLSQTGAYTFASAIGGYAAQTALTVTVTNTGSQATGNLVATLGGTNSGSFTLSKSSISSIAASKTDTFTVVPKTGLAAGTYTATVTVSGGNGIASRSFNVSFTVIDASTVYVITGSGTSFTAVKNSQTIGTANQPIQTVIDAIRGNAAGQACVIQFGDGATTLNIGTASASFSGTGWGLITLLGKITGSVTAGTTGVIAIADAVSVTSTAEIENTSTAGGVNAIHNASTRVVTISGGTVSARGEGNGVWNASTGTVNISGGTVRQANDTGGCWVVCNYSTGTVNISGGTVSATTGVAVWNASTGKITVSGSAKVTSANTAAAEGTIVIANSGTDTAARLEISGGTVENTSTGNAIYNASSGAVNISGGTISAATGYSVYMNNSSAMLTLDGSPAITGRIRPSAARQLTTASGFTPSANKYTLEYASYADGNIAVYGGASHLSSFTLYNQTAWFLAASGSNIIITPAYNIVLSENGTYTFTAATTDYAAQTARTVTVTNSGNQATGNLTVALSGTGADSFTLSKSSISSITVGGNDTFTVVPKTGLATGTYTATVTVSGGANITPKTFNISFSVGTASISLSETGTYTFTEAPIGYAAPTPLTVTVTNSGGQATGNLDVELSGTGASSFTLSKSSISSIAASKTDTFTVVPKTGLVLGTYTATVTVSGGANITSKTFNVSFTVITPTYGITLSESGTYTFPTAIVGYAAQTPLSVTVTNTGNQATGHLAIALSGTNSGSFTLSKSSINGIAGSGTDTFTIAPNTGLAAGTYTATVTVSGSSITSKTFNVSFTVIADCDYIITGSGAPGAASFTATARGGATVGTANQPIQTVIDAIRTHATGTNPSILLGNGIDVLDIGTATASFNNSGGTWGLITLNGKITGSVNTASTGVIAIANNVSVTSTADIANTGGTDGRAVYNASTGTVTISGGTVQAAAGSAVYNASTGAVTISGGTVQAATGKAVYSYFSSGVVSVSQAAGNTTLITSANPNGATIDIEGASSATGTTTTVRFRISGGTVENTANNANAITLRFAPGNYGVAEISGGTIQATAGKAVANGAGSRVNISGGTVKATTGIAVTSGPGTVYVSQDAGKTTLITSANTNTDQGTIDLDRAENTLKLEITGGRVENTSTTTGNTIRNHNIGYVNIKGGTISKAGTTGYALNKDPGAGDINVTGGTIDGARNW